MSAPRFVSFGEALVRFQPVPGESWKGVPSAVSSFTRSVGGDELNVMVALSRLGCDASWASVVPKGPLGDVVRNVAEEAGVTMQHVKATEGSMGCFHVFPEDRVTHFERKSSVFASMSGDLFDWDGILKERCQPEAPVWMHQTGIAPMTGPGALESWRRGLDAAARAGALISMDLNHRPALGTLEELWRIVEPELPKLTLLILSVDSTVALAELLTPEPAGKKPRVQAGGVYRKEDDLNSLVGPLVEKLHAKLNGPALACVMKTRDEKKLQQRWSLIVDADGLHTTAEVPTQHTPKDECGGGSAWAAGVIHSLSHALAGKPRGSGAVQLPPGAAAAAIRRGDILAALSQETVGDHCVAKLSDVEALEAQYLNKPVLTVALTDAKTRVQQALKRLDGARAIAILRVKHETRAVERAVELAEMGFQALEVTADSAGFAEGRLLPAVVKAVGQRCLVGVGTITTEAQLEVASRGGAHFALSPVNPKIPGGFVAACHQRGILAMPAAFTPQEVYECVEQGALTVKIFPAQLWTPSALKDLRRIGDFGKYRLCPSGGIDCSTAAAWLEAGAYAVGMGSCLVGKDVALEPSDPGLEAAERDWRTKGKDAAATFAKTLFR